MNEEQPIVKVCKQCSEALPIENFKKIHDESNYLSICNKCAIKNILKSHELFRNNVV